MNRKFLENIGKSLLRITAMLAIILGIPAFCYLIWNPGSNAPLPNYSNNAIWIGHGWLGDDKWFERNQRDKENFRKEDKIVALFKKLSQNKITTVYPHLCPSQMSGKIAVYDSTQVENFLDIAEKYNIKVIPWIGGVFEESARIEDKNWRKNFVESVDELLKKHPRLAGVQVNIEPLPSGNPDFLKLLEELRPITNGKILSVAAYPPPTKWHQFPDVHWNLPYIKLVATRCDQMAIMMYDTAIPLEKFYIKLMTDWTRQLVTTISSINCELLLGIPAYNDAEVGYHHPRVENIDSALKGISASGKKNEIKGISIYCEWEMDENKWKRWKKFIK